ncbi:hypothetical protein NFI96_024529 [Prochilodus magdalenae]|nr:hypothetical protein NFI96_024529 [Prochilodus magdalenae]
MTFTCGLLLALLGLGSMWQRTGGQIPGKPVFEGPPEGTVKEVVEFFCKVDEVPEGVSVHYELFKEGSLGKALGEYSALSGERATIPLYVKTAHDGRLICKASGQNNTEVTPSSSDPLRFKVIVMEDSLYESVMEDSLYESVMEDSLYESVMEDSLYESVMEDSLYESVMEDSLYESVMEDSLCVSDKIAGTHITSDPPDDEFWEGENVTLMCSVSAGTYVSYKWFRGGAPVQLDYSRPQNQLTFHSLSVSDSGRYICEASNEFNGTSYSNSSYDGKTLRVKERLSKLKISLVKITYQDEGLFLAFVKCEVKKGTSPVNFTLLQNGDLHPEIQAQNLTAEFRVFVQMDENRTWVQCQATDGTRTVQSKQLDLTVGVVLKLTGCKVGDCEGRHCCHCVTHAESVGGAVTMKVERTAEFDFEVQGVWLRCSVERGTFPHYTWYLNNTRLKKRGEFYIVFPPRDSVLAFALSPKATGVYHCEATNAFDNTTRLLSQRRLISKEVMNRIPLMVVLIVFACFFLLIVAVTACCLYGMVLRKKKARKHRALREDFAERSSTVEDVELEDGDDEDGLSADGYEEDVDVVEASRIEESDEDQADEEDSVPDEEGEEEQNLLDEELSGGAGAEL